LVIKITYDNPKNKDTIKDIKVNDNILNIEDNLKETSNVLINYFTDVGKNLTNKFNKRSNLAFSRKRLCIRIKYNYTKL